MNELLPHPSLESAIRRFNPGILQTDEEVKRQFVVRNGEASILLEVIRGNIGAASCQHMLLIGPSGIGKTMLLARIAAEIRTDVTLSERMLPVRFMEENPEIFHMADFWLETLFQLAKECAENEPELSRQLLGSHADLCAGWRDRYLEEHARATVLTAVDRLGKQLVIMVENLQELYRNVDAIFGWKLRHSLQCDPEIVLLATATNRFEWLDKIDEPFFEMFRELYLGPLDSRQCRQLWYMATGDSVSERETAPLKILTGGNPRALVAMAESARHRTLPLLIEELVHLIDSLSECYRGSLEALAKSERRVYLSVVDLWQPSSVSEIAARARMDVRAVSALLGRLVSRGIVIVEGRSRKRRYVAAERLCSIYYKLRREGRQAVAVRDLVRFMTVFFHGLERTATGYQDVDSMFPDVAQPGLGHDSDLTVDSKLDTRTHTEIREAFRDREYEKVVELADRLPAPPDTVPAAGVEMSTALMLLIKALALEELGMVEEALTACNQFLERFRESALPELRAPVATALVARAGLLIGAGGPGTGPVAVEDSERCIGAWSGGHRQATELQVECPRTGAPLDLGRLADALAAFKSAYAVLEPCDENMLSRVLGLSLRLVWSGVSVHELIDILASDRRKAGALEPLLIALRQSVNQSVRAPAETLEVAEHVRRVIEEGTRKEDAAAEVRASAPMTEVANRKQSRRKTRATGGERTNVPTGP